jgi:hypothetical protein
MDFLPKFAWISMLAAATAAVSPETTSAQTAQIRNIAVHSSATSTQIEIETTRRVMPLTQVLSDPDRLVIDIPDALPGQQLHELPVNQGEVKAIRAALVSSSPLMTRVVIDLRSPQDFRVTPSGNSLIVSVGRGTATSVASLSARIREPAPPAKAPETVIAPRAVDNTPARPVTKSAPPVASGLVAPPVQPPTSGPVTVPSRPVVVPRTDPHPTPTVAPKVAETTPARPASEPVPPVASPVGTLEARSAPAAPVPVPVPFRPPLPVPRTDSDATATVAYQRAQIERIALLRSAGATEIEIQISQRVTPTTQLITDPDRLVIDFPQAVPGPQLRALPVNQGQVKGVRTGLLSANPPVTRVVVDLKSPQEFQLFPSNRSVILKLPGGTGSPAAPTPSPMVPQVAHFSPGVPVPAPAPEKKVTIHFQDGLLSLTSNKGSLSDVLTQIGLATGADMSIPADAEQEKVAASLGPGSPRDVLAQLLNGSRYNFIIMGSDANANKLARVIITAKSAEDVGVQILPAPQAAPEIDPGPPARDVAAAAPPSSMSVPRNAPPAGEAQPQGEAPPPPPDTPPQPGDPQPAPN